jgi:enoyl-CoA hydratase/carnithine racemase
MGLLPGDVERPRLEDYARKYEHILVLERADGILEARLHSEGGVFGSSGWFNVWHQAWAEIGNDPENEVVIITATGDRWIDYLSPVTAETRDEDITEEMRSAMLGLTSEEGALELYTGALKNTQNVIFGLNVPTIGVIQAPAFVHYEAALFCDITLCSDDAVFNDPHANLGLPPGDGLGMAYQHLMSPKQQAYYLYTSDTIDAQTALRLGLVNEALPVDDLMPRAREIARRIMRLPKLSRLMTKQIVRRSAERRYVDDGGFHLAHELVSLIRNIADGTAHSPEQVREGLQNFEGGIRHARDS